MDKLNIKDLYHPSRIYLLSLLDLQLPHVDGIFSLFNYVSLSITQLCGVMFEF